MCGWVYDRTQSWSEQTRETVLKMEYGGMNEAMYDAYEVTKNEKDLIAGHAFDELSLFTPVAKGEDVLSGFHANTMIPKFIGALRRYMILGEDEQFYYIAAKNFWDMVTRHHSYITGGNSNVEHFHDPDVLAGDRSRMNCETCNIYNMLKLTRLLFTLTGEEKYAHFYDRAFHNAILGSQNPHTGMTTYFNPMETGYFKVYGTPYESFWCCSGTGLENFTKLGDSLYFHEDDILYVNGYLSGSLAWEEKGFRLSQKAGIEYEGASLFTVDKADAKATLTVKFLVPEWSKKAPTLQLNGQTLSSQQENGYIAVSRVWQAGDTLRIGLFPGIGVSRLPDDPSVVAFTYGPYVLSAGLGTEDFETFLTGSAVSLPTRNLYVKDWIRILDRDTEGWIDHIEKHLVRKQGQFAFILDGTDEDDHLVFEPYYSQHDQRYGIYWRVTDQVIQPEEPAPRKVVEDKLHDFEYEAVTLEKSLWKDQRDYTVELYLGLSNDDLLHRFRMQAGLPSEANGLPGWGPQFPQYIGAFAKLYKVTGDERLKTKAIELFEGWAECVRFNSDLLTMGTYVYDKFMGGLMDIFEYLGWRRVLAYASLLTERAMGVLKKDIKRDGLQDDELCRKGMIEWYTLPENLFRAYELTGDEKYKEFALEWDYTHLWDMFLKHDFNIGPRHAYSHVNSFSSAARAYGVTGDEKYLEAIRIGYDEVTQHHTYATGGYGPAETMFVDHEGFLGDMLKSPWDDSFKEDPRYVNLGDKKVARSDAWGSCEVSCCAWAVFKLCNYLLKYTGEAKYGAWAEQMLINGTGGQIPITKDGKVLYYANYYIDGAIKSTEDRRLHPNGANFAWQCCTGTFPHDVAEYANMLYYHDDKNLYVSQYVPSTVQWEKDGTWIELTCVSDFPEEPIVRFRVKTSNPVSFALKLRVPSWATGENAVKINGLSEPVECLPDTWAVIEREWKDGDFVSLSLPYTLSFQSVDEKNNEIVALCYGPVVLASTEMTILVGDRENPEDWIKPVPGKPLTFITEPGHTGPTTSSKGYSYPITRSGKCSGTICITGYLIKSRIMAKING